jgi:hypothetical protein
MAHRHKMHEKHKEHEKKASGGKVHGGLDSKKGGGDDYAGSGKPDVVKDAEHKKHGGKVHGEKSHERLDKRARGGRIHKSGGGDCTKSPFTAAHIKTSGDA